MSSARWRHPEHASVFALLMILELKRILYSRDVRLNGATFFVLRASSHLSHVKEVEDLNARPNLKCPLIIQHVEKSRRLLFFFSLAGLTVPAAPADPEEKKKTAANQRSYLQRQNTHSDKRVIQILFLEDGFIKWSIWVILLINWFNINWEQCGLRSGSEASGPFSVQNFSQ